jgi:hypothetical protein
MKVFHCDHCQQLVFFESTQCVNCGRALAFLPDLKIISSLETARDGLWTSRASRDVRSYRLCENYVVHNVCNWAIPEQEPHRLCESCRLTRLVPDLRTEDFREAWYKLEGAKRRLIYTLHELQCFVKSKSEDARGVAYEFLAEPEEFGAIPVLSGHSSGIITINIAEANDAERERRRLQLHEPYRTLLGHLRHESGHYYWDLLIKDSASIGAFRNLFGDERLEYGRALQDYYNRGALPNWQQSFVTTYASAHPWEDWAETWAHYLHMVDTLETAEACGLSLRPIRGDEPALHASWNSIKAVTPIKPLIDRWIPLTYVLNNLNRGMGLIDVYPFVLSIPAIEKLSFVHETIHSNSANQQATG